MKPADLGLPLAFTGWRPNQLDTALQVATSEKRFNLIQAPCGTGKSLLYTAIAKLLNARMVVLTGSRALQSQLMADFENTGMRDVRGHSNHRCVAVDRGGQLSRYARPGTTCADAPCRIGIPCDLRSSGCLSYDSRRIARTASSVVTNYAMWLTLGKYGDEDSLGKVDLLVLDEATNAHEWLAKYASIIITADELIDIGVELPALTALDEWCSWAGSAVSHAREAYRERRSTLGQSVNGSTVTSKSLSTLADLGNRLKSLAGIRNDASTSWIVQATTESVKASPVWASQFAERDLFRNVSRVILTSATLSRDDASLLGIPDTDYSYHEVPSPFDPSRHPFYYHAETFVDKRLLDPSYGDTLKLLVNRFDAFMGPRLALNRKGILQATSYEWARRVYELSRYRDRLIAHGRHDAREALARYRSSPHGCGLISPVTKEGHDFPLELCRWQIIIKLPFPDQRDPLTDARCKSRPGYRLRLISRSLEQMHGRGMRRIDDGSETIIFDRHWEWFKREAEQHFTKAFRATWRTVNQLPEPLGL